MKSDPKESKAKSEEQAPTVSGTAVTPPVIDKLSFILPAFIGIDYVGGLPEDLLRRIDRAIEKNFAKKWHSQQSRFRMNLRFNLPSGARAQVQIGAKKPMEQKGGIRVELNPSKLKEGDIELLYKRLRKVLGEYADLDDLLMKARVSRIDIAVNVIGCAIGDLLIGYKGVNQFTVFGNTMKGGEFQSANFGSLSSDYRAAVYDKRDETLRRILEAAEKGGGAEGLKTARVAQLKAAASLPPTLRVEVRGMKIGVPVHKLLNAGKNRFERFQFVELDGLTELSELERRAFLALVRQMGLKKAVELYRGDPLHSHLQKVVQQSASWWQPVGLWKEGVKALAKSGIFPKEAFKKQKKKD